MGIMAAHPVMARLRRVAEPNIVMVRLRRVTEPNIVMAGLDPAIRSGTVLDWMAGMIPGTSPGTAMTMGQLRGLS